ncbi:MAG TPA: hypothetical protein VN894_08790 [Polyangiaceae bacterium]|nr:hypothetical protein [Polyangiaceae bacterium]
MRVVKMAVDDVIDVLAVRDRGVAAARAVTMRAGVRSAVVPLRAGIRVLLADRDGVLVEVVTVDMVKMAIVQVVAMTLVLDDRVTAAFLVLVLVFLVNEMGAHASCSWFVGES